VAETTVKKRLLCYGFRRTGKEKGEVYQMFFFFGFEHHMFYVSYPFVTYLLTFPRSHEMVKEYATIGGTTAGMENRSTRRMPAPSATSSTT
jgi:hypothetical protein